MTGPPLKSIAPLLESLIEVQYGKIRLHGDPPWLPSNPSIAIDEGGYRMLVRTSNRFLRPKLKPPDWVNQNHTYLLTLGEDFEPLSCDRINFVIDATTYPAPNIGPKDCRLFGFGGEWFALGSMAELNPEIVTTMTLFKIDGSDGRSLQVLEGPERGRNEKNWMPFVRDEQLLFVYGCAPTRILSCDPATGTVFEISNKPVPSMPERQWRGGSQGIDLGDSSTLFVIHEKNRLFEGRIYLHRFVRLDPDFQIDAVSPAFSFMGKRIEFCAGAGARDGTLLLSLGISDRTAWLASVSLESVLELLQPIEG